MEGMINNQTLIFNSVEDLVDEFGYPFLTPGELRTRGINHILVRGSGYLEFSLVMERKDMFKLVEKDFTDIIEEKIKGFRGVYGFIGVSPGLLRSYKDIKELEEKGKLYTVIVEYNGPCFIVNSGIYTGMVIITSNFSDIKFKSINS